jgi:glutamine synthetase
MAMVTLENVEGVLEHDNKVKLAGVDVDGILRGKLISKKKFLSVVEAGFGFCSVIFGWDMHDTTYFKELKISNAENGYRDLIAKIDLGSFRRIPWEDDVPFFLVSFHDPDTEEPVCACPRGLLRRMVARIEEKGYGAMAGGRPPSRRTVETQLTSQPSTSSTSSRRHPTPPMRRPRASCAGMPRTRCRR